ncbi:MAG: hypothetical protein KIT60_09580 [Burkholderiaceae bacterium]|nr:hypothetical protein [Burkholderiaceae bacterium]
MSASSNFFASLVDPSAVLALCEQSPALKTLTRQRHSADRPGRMQSTEWVAWDAAVDEGKPLGASRARSAAGELTSENTLLEAVAA